MAGVLIGCLFMMLASPYIISCTYQLKKPGNSYVTIQEFCWGLENFKKKTIGCSAQNVIIKASLCEIEIIIEKQGFLGLDQEQKDFIRSRYRRFKRGYKLRQAKLNLESLKLNEILQMDQFEMRETERELKKVRLLCSRLSTRAISTLIAIKEIFTPQQRRKLRKILIPASPKIGAEKRYPVIPCGE